MTSNKRIFLNIIATNGKVLHGLVIGICTIDVLSRSFWLSLTSK